MRPKCARCGKEMQQRYVPMKEWGMEGPVCGACYSAGLDEHYPGDHVRINRG